MQAAVAMSASRSIAGGAMRRSSSSPASPSSLAAASSSAMPLLIRPTPRVLRRAALVATAIAPPSSSAGAAAAAARTSGLAPARRPATARKEKASPSSPSPPAAYTPFPSSSSGGSGSSSFSSSPNTNDTPPPASVFSEAARKALFRAADSCRKVGWGSFWTQLALSIASAGILLFSVAFTAQNGPAVSLYATLFGVVASFLSTFWTYGYTRLARRLRALAAAAARGGPLPADMVRKGDVVATLRAGCYVNLAGLAATLLGLQATVGLLVAKTLTNATANPFLAGGAGSYSPVLALDVFLVQASTNTALAHFVSLVASLWLIKVVGAPVPAGSGSRA